MNKVDIYLENRKLDIDYIDLALTYSFSDLLVVSKRENIYYCI